MALTRSCLGPAPWTCCPENRSTTGSRCLPCERAYRRATGYGTAGYLQRRAAVINAEPYCHTQPRCPYTNTQANPLTADHVVPVARGGAAGPLVPLCLRCNSAKRDRGWVGSPQIV